MRKRFNADDHIWPGFVDVMSNLLIIILFVLFIFVLAQFFLKMDLSSKDENIKDLQGQLHALMTNEKNLKLDVLKLSGILEQREEKISSLQHRLDQEKKWSAKQSLKVDELNEVILNLEGKIIKADQQKTKRSKPDSIFKPDSSNFKRRDAKTERSLGCCGSIDQGSKNKNCTNGDAFKSSLGQQDSRAA